MHGVLHREFFGQGWMKLEKNERTPYIMKNTKHFNDVSAASGQGQGAGAAAQPHLAQCWPGLGAAGFVCLRLCSMGAWCSGEHRRWGASWHRRAGSSAPIAAAAKSCKKGKSCKKKKAGKLVAEGGGGCCPCDSGLGLLSS